MRYIYNGGSLDSVIIYASGGSVTCYLKYLYSASGELEYILRKKDNFSDPAKYDLFAVVYNGKGEITKLIKTRYQKSTGVGYTYFVAANYTYDAFGNVTVSSPVSGEDIGWVNPLRYKNYIFDTETDWYYLQTRFYDPAVGRFLNADGYADTGDSVLGTNMFAYCGNNPLNYLDSTGSRRMSGRGKRLAQRLNMKKEERTQQQKQQEDLFAKRLYNAIDVTNVPFSNLNEKPYLNENNYVRYRVDIEKAGGTRALVSMPHIVEKVAEKKLLETGYGSTDYDVKQFVGELYAHAYGYSLSLHQSENLKIADIDVHPIRGVFDERWQVNVISWLVGVMD